jgi:hypothetical protein
VIEEESEGVSESLVLTAALDCVRARARRGQWKGQFEGVSCEFQWLTSDDGSYSDSEAEDRLLDMNCEEYDGERGSSCSRRRYGATGAFPGRWIEGRMLAST